MSSLTVVGEEQTKALPAATWAQPRREALALHHVVLLVSIIPQTVKKSRKNGGRAFSIDDVQRMENAMTFRAVCRSSEERGPIFDNPFFCINRLKALFSDRFPRRARSRVHSERSRELRQAEYISAVKTSDRREGEARSQKIKAAARLPLFFGAGYGNRTRLFSLGS